MSGYWTEKDLEEWELRKRGDRRSIEPAKPVKRMKYGNERVEVDGIKFDSKREAAEYVKLKALSDASQIESLRLQPAFMLQESFTDYAGRKVKPILYRADFEYWQGGKHYVIDAKGVRTEGYRIKAKMFMRLYPDIVFMEV